MTLLKTLVIFFFSKVRKCKSIYNLHSTHGISHSTYIQKVVFMAHLAQIRNQLRQALHISAVSLFITLEYKAGLGLWS